MGYLKICVIPKGYHSISSGILAPVSPKYHELGVPEIAPADRQKE